MADVNPQDIMKLLQQSASSQKSYADKLREQREARQAELSQFADQTGSVNDFQTPGGVPLNPADVINAKSLFARSLSNAIEPYSPELEQKARASEADILTQIYQLSQKDKEITEKTSNGVTIDPKTGAVKLDPTISAYVDLFKNGSMKKVTEIPAEDRGKVVEAMSALGIDLAKVAREVEGNKVSGAIKALHELYTLGENPDLSQGRVGGTVNTVGGLLGLSPDVKTYNQNKKALVASIKGITGDTGVMTEQDAQRLQGLLPKVTDTPEEASKQWQFVSDFFKQKYGIDLGIEGVSSSSSVDKDDEDLINKYKNMGAK